MESRCHSHWLVLVTGVEAGVLVTGEWRLVPDTVIEAGARHRRVEAGVLATVVEVDVCHRS